MPRGLARLAEPVYTPLRRISVWLSFVASVSAITQGHSAAGYENGASAYIKDYR
jgi:hypothetical protein